MIKTRTTERRCWRIPVDMLGLDGSIKETLPLIQKAGLKVVAYDGKPNPRVDGESIESYLVDRKQGFKREDIQTIKHPRIDRSWSYSYRLIDPDGKEVLRYTENPVHLIGIAVETE
ncbi:hypothetical protein HOC86_02870 [archaeon]|nr:hypothetical protein [archaeon]